MNNAANTRFVFRSSRPKSNDVGTVMGLCGLLFALIMGRVVSDAFFYVFAAAALAVFALSNTKIIQSY